MEQVKPLSLDCHEREGAAICPTASTETFCGWVQSHTQICSKAADLKLCGGAIHRSGPAAIFVVNPLFAWCYFGVILDLAAAPIPILAGTQFVEWVRPGFAQPDLRTELGPWCPDMALGPFPSASLGQDALRIRSSCH